MGLAIAIIGVAVNNGLTVTETIFTGLIVVIVGGLIVKYWGEILRKIQMAYWRITGHPNSPGYKSSFQKIEEGIREEKSWLRWWWKWWERRRS